MRRARTKTKEAVNLTDSEMHPSSNLSNFPPAPSKPFPSRRPAFGDVQLHDSHPDHDDPSHLLALQLQAQFDAEDSRGPVDDSPFQHHSRSPKMSYQSPIHNRYLRGEPADTKSVPNPQSKPERIAEAFTHQARACSSVGRPVVPNDSLRTRTSPHVSSTDQELREFIWRSRETSCGRCGSRLISTEADADEVVTSWVDKKSPLYGPLRCKLCLAYTCGGCGADGATTAPDNSTTEHNVLPWCCEPSRLLVIWLLLCGYEHRTHAATEQRKQKTSREPSRASPLTHSKRPRGVGYGGIERHGPPLDHYHFGSSSFYAYGSQSSALASHESKFGNLASAPAPSLPQKSAAQSGGLYDAHSHIQAEESSGLPYSSMAWPVSKGGLSSDQVLDPRYQSISEKPINASGISPLTSALEDEYWRLRSFASPSDHAPEHDTFQTSKCPKHSTLETQLSPLSDLGLQSLYNGSHSSGFGVKSPATEQSTHGPKFYKSAMGRQNDGTFRDKPLPKAANITQSSPPLFPESPKSGRHEAGKSKARVLKYENVRAQTSVQPDAQSTHSYASTFDGILAEQALEGHKPPPLISKPPFPSSKAPLYNKQPLKSPDSGHFPSAKYLATGQYLPNSNQGHAGSWLHLIPQDGYDMVDESPGWDVIGMDYRRRREDASLSELEVKVASKPHDEFTAAVLELLCQVLPSINHDTSFDKQPPPVLASLVTLSSILDEVAELLRNDSIDDATKRRSLYHSVIDFVCRLGKHGATADIIKKARTRKADRTRLFGCSRGAEKAGSAADQTPAVAVSMQNLLQQSRMILRSAQKNADELLSEEAQEMLLLCHRITDLADQTLSSSPTTRQLACPTQAGKGIDWGAWHKANCMLEVPDEAMFKDYRYTKEAKAAMQAPKGRMKRLIEEGANLSTSLPPGVFVRYASSRPDVLKVLIVGPADTPYEGGLFEFDVWCPPNYPWEPPKFTFRTTGRGGGRFNPNLYEDGKVCLSLLNTWPGERWKADESTMLQVLVSLQSMVFCEQPYYNEPGHELNGSSRDSTQYDNRVRGLTVRLAMRDWVRRGHETIWKSVAKEHFTRNRDKITQVTRQWASSSGVGVRAGDVEELEREMLQMRD